MIPLFFNAAEDQCGCCPVFGMCSEGCQKCQKGQFNEQYNQTTCLDCPVGTFSK